MKPFLTRCLAILLCTVVCSTSLVDGAFGSHSDRVLLKDVSALTLQSDRMTSGRRSSPVPQLSCVGGTARGYFTPKVVQCYNRGSDGNDIQWECKTDMDNAFRFGSVEVTCEGYDYPDDPYILKGSCGLEYTLDFTEEGYQRYKQQKSHTYGGHHSDSNYHGSYQGSWGKKGKSVVGDLLFLGGVAVVIYIVYKSCLSSNASQDAAGTDRSREPRADMRGDQPPPYGFRPEYMSRNDPCSDYDSHSYTNTHANTNANAGNQGGGFWSGAATGGLLGYLFGRNSGPGTYTNYHHHRPNTRWGWGQPNTGFGSSWGSGWGSQTSYGGSTSSFSSGGSSASSGTHTASGFGGTRRR